MYAVRYSYVPGMEQRREPYRAAHLAWLRELDGRGELVLAGALTEPVDGAWIVVRADSAAAARTMVNADPYAAGGLIASVTIRSISVVVPSDG